MTKIGHFYYSGINKGESNFSLSEFSIKEDKKVALQMYNKASEKGDSEASNSLGLMYENGVEVIQDSIKAEQNYRLAIDQNKENADAILNLGLLLVNSQNEFKYEEGVKMLKLAMSKGNQRAKEYLILNDLLVKQNNFM